MASSLIDSSATISRRESLKASDSYFEPGHLKYLVGNCTTMKFDLSENEMKLTEMIQIAQLLRENDKLQALNICNNTAEFYTEVEFIVDVILSVNSNLSELVINGTNMRPRLSSYSKILVNNASENFSLQHLYIADSFPLYLSNKYMFRENFVTCSNGNKINENFREKCPFSNSAVFSHYVDHKGGVYYYKDHDVALFIPPGAVLQDEQVEIIISSSFYGEFHLPQNYDRISSFVWVSAKYHFKIPVYLIIGHFVDIKSVKNIKTLSAFEACELNGSRDADETLKMQEVCTSYFDTDLRYCVISTNHFCTYCLAELQSLPNQKCDSHKRFLTTYYSYKEVEDHKIVHYVAEICCFYCNKNCLKVSDKYLYIRFHSTITSFFHVNTTLHPCCVFAWNTLTACMECTCFVEVHVCKLMRGSTHEVHDRFVTSKLDCNFTVTLLTI